MSAPAIREDPDRSLIGSKGADGGAGRGGRRHSRGDKSGLAGAGRHYRLSPWPVLALASTRLGQYSPWPVLALASTRFGQYSLWPPGSFGRKELIAIRSFGPRWIWRPDVARPPLTGLFRPTFGAIFHSRCENCRIPTKITPRAADRAESRLRTALLAPRRPAALAGSLSRRQNESRRRHLRAAGST
jgi:hypothetical protein